MHHLLDSHVHLHACFERGAFLARAHANLAAAAQARGLGPADWQGWLLLTEMDGDDAFGELARGEGVPAGWRIRPTAEPVALIAESEAAARLLLVAGRQNVTAEGIEVLTLGTDQGLPERMPLADTLAAARAAGRFVVLPWGFGKWLGRRGRLLVEALAAGRLDGCWLGDIAGRPVGTPTPRLFRLGERRGLRILGGTDPLAMRGEGERVGRYGSLVAGEVDPDRPWASLRALLEAHPGSPPTFGARDGLGQALRTQGSFKLGGAAGLPHDTATPDVETASEGYARRFAGPVGRWFLDVQERTLAELLGPAGGTPLRVLEVGGGHGQLTAFLLAQGHEVWVQGSRPACAARILPLAEGAGGRLRFVSAGLWQLPFPDRSFDLVVAIRLLAHVEDLDGLLAEMARVCRHRLVVDFAPLVGVNAFEPLLFAAKRRLEGNTRPFFSHTAGRLERILRPLGFTRFQQRRQFFVPMVVHRAAKRPGLSAASEAVCRRLGLTTLLGAPAMLLAERPQAEGSSALAEVPAETVHAA